MLFVKSKTSEDVVDGVMRIKLLDMLQEKGMVPLIRSARLNAYELALLGPERAKEMELAVAAWTESEDQAAYIRGDVFCFEDHVLFLLIGNAKSKLRGMRAGIVYAVNTTEPLDKLDAFCRNVSEALDAAEDEQSISGNGTTVSASGEWQRDAPRVPAGFTRYSAQQGSNGSVAEEEASVERLLAAEVLQDLGMRRFLHRIREAHTDGRVSGLLANDEHKDARESYLNDLLDAGLIKREVVVSCHRSGRALFRMPSLDALTVLTSSNVQCSECGALIADEKIEDLVAPTELAPELLDDGKWLTDRFRFVLRKLSIPDKEVVVGPTSGDGEVHLMVNVRGEPFLCVLKEEDWTPAHARRAIDVLIENDAAHLVVVTTGRIQTEARARLQDYAKRRMQSGRKIELILVEGVDAASTELQQTFERVSERALAEELCELDPSLGISVGYMIATRFRLVQKNGALRDLAESDVDAIAGRLREI